MIRLLGDKNFDSLCLRSRRWNSHLIKPVFVPQDASTFSGLFLQDLDLKINCNGLILNRDGSGELGSPRAPIKFYTRAQQSPKTWLELGSGMRLSSIGWVSREAVWFIFSEVGPTALIFFNKKKNRVVALWLLNFFEKIRSPTGLFSSFGMLKILLIF